MYTIITHIQDDKDFPILFHPSPMIVLTYPRFTYDVKRFRNIHPQTLIVYLESTRKSPIEYHHTYAKLNPFKTEYFLLIEPNTTVDWRTFKFDPYKLKSWESHFFATIHLLGGNLSAIEKQLPEPLMIDDIKCPITTLGIGTPFNYGKCSRIQDISNILLPVEYWEKGILQYDNESEYVIRISNQKPLVYGSAVELCEKLDKLRLKGVDLVIPGSRHSAGRSDFFRNRAIGLNVYPNTDIIMGTREGMKEYDRLRSLNMSLEDIMKGTDANTDTNTDMKTNMKTNKLHIYIDYRNEFAYTVRSLEDIKKAHQTPEPSTTTVLNSVDIFLVYQSGRFASKITHKQPIFILEDTNPVPASYPYYGVIIILIVLLIIVYMAFVAQRASLNK